MTDRPPYRAVGSVADEVLTYVLLSVMHGALAKDMNANSNAPGSQELLKQYSHDMATHSDKSRPREVYDVNATREMISNASVDLGCGRSGDQRDHVMEPRPLNDGRRCGCEGPRMPPSGEAPTCDMRFIPRDEQTRRRTSTSSFANRKNLDYSNNGNIANKLSNLGLCDIAVGRGWKQVRQ